MVVDLQKKKRGLLARRKKKIDGAEPDHETYTHVTNEALDGRFHSRMLLQFDEICDVQGRIAWWCVAILITQ